MKSIGLEALIAPQTREEFFWKAWPKEPFVVHGLSSSVRALTEISFLQSLEAMLGAWSGDIQVHLPDHRDESSSISVKATEAPKYFEEKMALLFNNVHHKSPVLEEWLQALAKDLGLPASTISRCMVYATPDGQGTAPHFDQNINFVLQLHGTKKWWIAENTVVENPTERFVMGRELDPELSSYAATEMPTTMPSDQQEIVLEPGSMLFVPRGYWHSTEARGEALALNFTFSQPTWVDLFTMALRSRLLQSTEWRELADGVNSADHSKKILAQQNFDALLAALVEDLPNWQASEILSATEGR